MTWQEYQEAVAVFYEQIEGVGTVLRDQRIPDRVTGQHRQVDTLLTLETKGHSISVLIDAKFHSEPIDVKSVEEVAALATAVGACKSIIVAANGWTQPAEIKAEHLSCDLRLLSLEGALDLLVPDKWMMCPSCQNDCMVLDAPFSAKMNDGLEVWWLEGACRQCRCAFVWCQDCGIQHELKVGESITCDCGYHWQNNNGSIAFSCVAEGRAP